MIGYVDCYSGVSGDMLLGALVDAGLPLASLERTVRGLGLEDVVTIDARPVSPSGIRATSVRVMASDSARHRTFGEIRAALHSATGLEDGVRERSLQVLGRLAATEARIHGTTVDEVELHEVGALDSIVDVVCVVAGLAELDVTSLYASAVPLAPGSIAHSAHGPLPSPGPATLDLLASANAPTRPFGDGHELVTPTGAALLVSLATFHQPTMRLERIGYGAGDAELPWPNVLRLWLGTPVRDAEAEASHVVIETNIDDMSPQLLAPVVQRLLEAGALDVTLAPVLMKKGRQATQLGVIAPAESESRLAALLLEETTTLGVRSYRVRRYEADRALEPVATPYGTVMVKLKIIDGRVAGAMPEFESVREVAERTGVPLLTVHAAAVAASSERIEPATHAQAIG